MFDLLAQDGGEGAAGASFVASTEADDAVVWSAPVTDAVPAGGVDASAGAVAMVEVVDSLFVVVTSDFNRSTVAYASASCARSASTSRVFSPSADCSCRTSSSSWFSRRELVAAAVCPEVPVVFEAVTAADGSCCTS